MKILHLTEHYLPFLGGVEVNTHEICKRLAKDGFEVEVVCEREFDAPEIELKDRVKIHRVFGFRLIKLRYNAGRIAPGMLLSSLINEADVIHAHSYGFFPTWASIFCNKPTIITTHSDPTARIYPLWDMLRAIPVRMCDRVVATTHMERHRLIQIGVNPERITVIPNGVTLPPLNVPNADFSPMILCLARLDITHKGQDILLHAMPKVLSAIPKTKLFMVGDGDDLEKLKALTKKLNIEERVEFKGLAFPPIKNLYLKNCDVLCISPRTESFGIVYLEAMAYGRPIVTTNVGGIPEVVDDCAILVPPNPDSLADALIEVLTDEKLSKMLGENGLRQVQRFNWDLIVPKYEALYESLLKR